VVKAIREPIKVSDFDIRISNFVFLTQEGRDEDFLGDLPTM